jgi:GTP-binding protein
VGKKRRGRGGAALILKVPRGTLLEELPHAPRSSPPASEAGPLALLGDLRHRGDRIVVVRGGRGGYGNAHFKSSTRQRPDFAELGEPGEKKSLKLELKLVADVGIIGYPNVGKSTLIAAISAARPKIADYPFTTLVPNLGVVKVRDRSFVVCDVPGLIEGASEGKGLGGQFLRHIERCGVLLHLLDVSRGNAEALSRDYRAIRKELEAYSPLLARKRELILLNKIDLIGFDAHALEKELKKHTITIFQSISGATKHGTDELAQKLLPLVLKQRTQREPIEDKVPAELPVLRPHLSSERMEAYRIDRLKDGSICVTGKRLEQFTQMTDFKSPGAVRRFRDVLERIGLLRALRKHLEERKPVLIGDVRIDHHLP